MQDKEDYFIDDYNYIVSTLGNAFFSGLTFSELWDCIFISNDRESLNTAIETAIKLKEMIKEKKYE